MPFIVRLFATLGLIFTGYAAAQTTDATVNVKGAITGATCSITLSSNVDFGSVTARAVLDGSIEKSITFTRNCDWTESNTKVRFIPALGTVSGQTNNGYSIMKSGLNGIAVSVTKMGLYGILNFNQDYDYHEKTIDLRFKLLPVTAEQMTVGKIDTSLILRLTYD